VYEIFDEWREWLFGRFRRASRHAPVPLSPQSSPGDD